MTFQQRSSVDNWSERMERLSAHSPRFHLVTVKGEAACGADVWLPGGEEAENPPKADVCGKPACWRAWCKLNNIPLSSATGSRAWAR